MREFSLSKGGIPSKESLLRRLETSKKAKQKQLDVIKKQEFNSAASANTLEYPHMGNRIYTRYNIETAWTNWTSAGTTTNGTIAIGIWENWATINATSTLLTSSLIVDAYSRNRVIVKETPEEKAFRKQRAAEFEERNRLALIEREKAELRAEQLLISLLTEDQRKQFKDNNFFVVHGKSGLRYRLRRGRTGNVDVIDRSGKLLHRLCAHPQEMIPDCDTLAAQKLMLECDDLDFSSKANIHPIYGTSSQLILPALMN